MRQYISLQTDEDVDDLQAELWTRFYDDRISLWTAWAALPDSQLPPSYVAAGKPIPEYGQPIDFHSRTQELVWTTQVPFGVQIHRLDGGGGGVAIIEEGRHGAKIDDWIRNAGTIAIPPPPIVAALRDVIPDVAATKARGILDVPDAATMKVALQNAATGTPAEMAAANAVLNARGATRSRPVKIANSADLVERASLTGAWLDKVDEVEAAAQAAALTNGRQLR